ncbi:hypothetical protein [Leptothoe sp. PORK10 BA2]|uniref:hypothetical protein n=1 Tax=Leptothoe sp. PORK10 BA2 TaxID=3110254 RepID=UPI002B21F2FD|nr:hypothetical protein [Leptothoe sp. PORK10 BA2]MEA5466853.1 hypothetical protein [Leptothoe sp. PORK10 BA2]
MTSVIFVHGTGGRKEAYAATFDQIEQTLSHRRPDVALFSCLWGDDYGAQLHAQGVSIPTHDVTSGGQTPTEDDKAVQLWQALYADPFYELRLLGLRPLQSQKAVPGKQTPAQELKSRTQGLAANEKLQATLDELKIGVVFAEACDHIFGKDSKPFGRLLATAASPLDGDYAAIARAIVSESRLLCKEREIYPWLLVSDRLRDQAVDAIQQVLTQDETSRGVVDWTKKHLMELAANLGTSAIQRRRGAIMDGTYPFAGDILLYQAKGHKIRELIRQQVMNDQVKPPVYLMAHSLGGIACVDLLIEQDLSPKVKGLITVGSQAPFFYEIGALQQLDYGDSLPPHFPKNW